MVDDIGADPAKTVRAAPSRRAACPRRGCRRHRPCRVPAALARAAAGSCVPRSSLVRRGECRRRELHRPARGRGRARTGRPAGGRQRPAQRRVAGARACRATSSRPRRRPNAVRPPATPADLQRRGSDLLRRSNDVHVVEDTHPAFARILSEITPDEARILRFIYLEGPQPAIDIRTNRPLGIGSVLVPGGHEHDRRTRRAAEPRPDRPLPDQPQPARAIDFSKEQVSNPTRYQVIEAQPKVVAALKTAGPRPEDGAAQRPAQLLRRGIRPYLPAARPPLHRRRPAANGTTRPAGRDATRHRSRLRMPFSQSS